jgi:hypothetical protein
MNRLITAAALSSLLAFGGSAEAAKKKPSPRAKVYRATFASTTGSAYAAVTGKAQLVDNKRKDIASIQLKGLLQPGAVYDWVIYKINGDKPACGPGGAGQGVESFRYKPLTVNASGNASATAKSKKFVAYTTTRYGVVVRNEEGADVVCAELKRKKTSKKPRA